MIPITPKIWSITSCVIAQLPSNTSSKSVLNFWCMPTNNKSMNAGKTAALLRQSIITWGDDTVNITSFKDVTVEIWSRGFQFLVITRHDRNMVDLIRANVVWGSQMNLDQRAHDLLRRFGGCDIWKNVRTMRLLSIANPTCSKKINAETFPFVWWESKSKDEHTRTCRC